MLDGLNRTVALKKIVCFFQFYQNYSKNILFSYFIKLYEYWGNFQSFHETKRSSMEKIMRQIFEEVIMSDRHMLDGQIYSFLQLLLNSEKIKLN